MRSASFTPGPWLIHAKHRWIVPAEDAFKDGADALPICALRDPDERLTEDLTLDNGFLIAAAPELYEALRYAEVALEGAEESYPTAGKVLPRIRAALAKARGES